MKKNLILILAFFLFPFLGICQMNGGSRDPVSRKFQGKMSYAQKQYQTDMKKIKYGMLKDYQVLMNTKMNAGDLEAANIIQKKIDYLKGKSDDRSVLDLDFNPPVTVMDSIFDLGENINIALAKNGYFWQIAVKGSGAVGNSYHSSPGR